MTKLNIISQNPESTLVAEFVPDQKRERNYQSGACSTAGTMPRWTARWCTLW